MPQHTGLKLVANSNFKEPDFELLPLHLMPKIKVSFSNEEIKSNKNQLMLSRLQAAIDLCGLLDESDLIKSDKDVVDSISSDSSDGLNYLRQANTNERNALYKSIWALSAKVPECCRSPHEKKAKKGKKEKKKKGKKKKKGTMKNDCCLADCCKDQSELVQLKRDMELLCKKECCLSVEDREWRIREMLRLNKPDCCLSQDDRTRKATMRSCGEQEEEPSYLHKKPCCMTSEEKAEKKAAEKMTRKYAKLVKKSKSGKPVISTIGLLSNSPVCCKAPGQRETPENVPHHDLACGIQPHHQFIPQPDYHSTPKSEHHTNLQHHQHTPRYAHIQPYPLHQSYQQPQSQPQPNQYPQLHPYQDQYPSSSQNHGKYDHLRFQEPTHETQSIHGVHFANDQYQHENVHEEGVCQLHGQYECVRPECCLTHEELESRQACVLHGVYGCTDPDCLEDEHHAECCIMLDDESYPYPVKKKKEKRQRRRRKKKVKVDPTTPYCCLKPSEIIRMAGETRSDVYKRPDCCLTPEELEMRRRERTPNCCLSKEEVKLKKKEQKVARKHRSADRKKTETLIKTSEKKIKDAKAAALKQKKEDAKEKEVDAKWRAKMEKKYGTLYKKKPCCSEKGGTIQIDVHENIQSTVENVQPQRSIVRGDCCLVPERKEREHREIIIKKEEVKEHFKQDNYDKHHNERVQFSDQKDDTIIKVKQKDDASIKIIQKDDASLKIVQKDDAPIKIIHKDEVIQQNLKPNNLQFQEPIHEEVIFQEVPTEKLFSNDHYDNEFHSSGELIPVERVCQIHGKYACVRPECCLTTEELDARDICVLHGVDGCTDPDCLGLESDATHSSGCCTMLDDENYPYPVKKKREKRVRKKRKKKVKPSEFSKPYCCLKPGEILRMADEARKNIHNKPDCCLTPEELAKRRRERTPDCCLSKEEIKLKKRERSIARKQRSKERKKTEKLVKTSEKRITAAKKSALKQKKEDAKERELEAKWRAKMEEKRTGVKTTRKFSLSSCCAKGVDEEDEPQPAKLIRDDNFCCLTPEYKEKKSDIVIIDQSEPLIKRKSKVTINDERIEPQHPKREPPKVEQDVYIPSGESLPRPIRKPFSSSEDEDVSEVDSKGSIYRIHSESDGRVIITPFGYEKKKPSKFNENKYYLESEQDSSQSGEVHRIHSTSIQTGGVQISEHHQLSEESSIKNLNEKTVKPKYPKPYCCLLPDEKHRMFEGSLLRKQENRPEDAERWRRERTPDCCLSKEEIKLKRRERIEARKERAAERKHIEKEIERSEKAIKSTQKVMKKQEKQESKELRKEAKWKSKIDTKQDRIAQLEKNLSKRTEEHVVCDENAVCSSHQPDLDLDHKSESKLDIIIDEGGDKIEIIIPTKDEEKEETPIKPEEPKHHKLTKSEEDLMARHFEEERKRRAEERKRIQRDLKENEKEVKAAMKAAKKREKDYEKERKKEEKWKAKMEKEQEHLARMERKLSAKKDVCKEGVCSTTKLHQKVHSKLSLDDEKVATETSLDNKGGETIRIIIQSDDENEVKDVGEEIIKDKEEDMIIEKDGGVMMDNEVNNEVTISKEGERIKDNGDIIKNEKEKEIEDEPSKIKSDSQHSNKYRYVCINRDGKYTCHDTFTYKDLDVCGLSERKPSLTTEPKMIEEAPKKPQYICIDKDGNFVCYDNINDKEVDICGHRPRKTSATTEIQSQRSPYICIDSDKLDVCGPVDLAREPICIRNRERDIYPGRMFIPEMMPQRNVSFPMHPPNMTQFDDIYGQRNIPPSYGQHPIFAPYPGYYGVQPQTPITTENVTNPPRTSIDLHGPTENKDTTKIVAESVIDPPHAELPHPIENKVDSPHTEHPATTEIIIHKDHETDIPTENLIQTPQVEHPVTTEIIIHKDQPNGNLAHPPQIAQHPATENIIHSPPTEHPTTTEIIIHKDQPNGNISLSPQTVHHPPTAKISPQPHAEHPTTTEIIIHKDQPNGNISLSPQTVHHAPTAKISPQPHVEHPTTTEIIIHKDHPVENKVDSPHTEHPTTTEIIIHKDQHISTENTIHPSHSPTKKVVHVPHTGFVLPPNEQNVQTHLLPICSPSQTLETEIKCTSFTTNLDDSNETKVINEEKKNNKKGVFGKKKKIVEESESDEIEEEEDICTTYSCTASCATKKSKDYSTTNSSPSDENECKETPCKECQILQRMIAQFTEQYKDCECLRNIENKLRHVMTTGNGKVCPETCKEEEKERKLHLKEEKQREKELKQAEKKRKKEAKNKSKSNSESSEKTVEKKSSKSSKKSRKGYIPVSSKESRLGDNSKLFLGFPCGFEQMFKKTLIDRKSRLAIPLVQPVVGVCTDGVCDGSKYQTEQPQTVTYAQVKITEFQKYLTYEIMKASPKKPFNMPNFIEQLFVKKKTNVIETNDNEKTRFKSKRTKSNTSKESVQIPCPAKNRVNFSNEVLMNSGSNKKKKKKQKSCEELKKCLSECDVQHQCKKKRKAKSKEKHR